MNDPRPSWMSPRTRRRRLPALVLLALGGLPQVLLLADEATPGDLRQMTVEAMQRRPAWSAAPETERRWPSVPPTVPNRTARGDGATGVPQPDLTGSWRGSGGEIVEIRGNRARIWGGRFQSCDCVFMIVGERLIAYSPDTDVVRKYRFRSNHDIFTLLDEQGQLMSFWRVR